MFYLIILSTVFLGLAIYYYIESRKIVKIMNKLPHIEPTPFIGNLKLFMTDPPGIFAKLMEISATYKNNYFLRGFLLDYSVQITDLHDIEFILSKNVSVKSKDYETLIPWLGTGLLISSGKKWFTRRRIITPTFHFKILESFTETFDKHGNIFVDKLKENSQHGEINIYDPVTLCALDIVCETSMGVDINAQTNKDSEYPRSVKTMSTILFAQLFSIFKLYPWVFTFTSSGFRQRQLLAKLHSFTDKIISERKKQLAERVPNNNNTTASDDTEYYGKKQKHTFLDLLLHATVDGKPLGPYDIREEVDTFMFEGHDTTASAITFALYNLAQNPDVQHRAYEEVANVFGTDSTTMVTTSTLAELKYLEMVIKESLRIHPSVPMVGRRLTENVVIGGVELPVGTNIGIHVYATHRDASIYPDPEKFDPERFTPENQSKRNPYSFIPFSAGSRNCIGQKFAMLEVKTILAKTLLNFKLLPSEKQKKITLMGDFILKPVDGIYLKFEPRA
jgi:cytochrome P450 family 4